MDHPVGATGWSTRRQLIGERTADPAAGDIRLASMLGIGTNDRRYFMLSADEEQLLAGSGERGGIGSCGIDAGNGLVEIENISAVFGTKKERGRRRVTACTAIAEMSANTKKGFYCCFCSHV